MAKVSMFDKLRLVAPPSVADLAAVENTIPDLDRILALPRRPPVNCSRDPLTKKYAPETQALVEVETAKFSRGPRISCGCRPRKVQLHADGKTLTISRVVPGAVPEAPVHTSLAAFLADNQTPGDEDVRRAVLAMQPGQEISLPAVDGENGHPCIVELAPPQAWFLREAAQEGGVVGFLGVGSGKCLSGDSEIFDLETGRRRLLSEAGTLSVSSLRDAQSSESIIVARPAAAFASGKKYCCRLLIADGSELKLSLDHQILTQRGWVQAQKLTTKDFVCVPTTIPRPKKETVAIDDEIAMVAFLLADGGCTNSTIAFTNETPSVIAEFQRIAKIVALGYTEINQQSKARLFHLLGTGSRKNFRTGEKGTGFREKWDLYGLSKEKRVKAEIWGLPTKQIALFINRFWACDGHVSKLELECTLASEKLIDDLRFLLLRIGVRSRKRFKFARLKGQQFNAWRISISGADALVFLNVVGDVLGKEEACQRLRDRLNSTKRNTNFDVVPIGRQELYEICDELGFEGKSKVKKYDGSRRRTTLIRDYFKATAGQFVSRGKFIEFCRQYNYRGKYSHLGSKDVCWERVVSVNEIGLQDVFDLTVPETQNFIANGMVVHNSIAFLLAATIFKDSRLGVLLIEPKQRQHYKSQYLRLREHFFVSSIVGDVEIRGSTVPGTAPLHLISYSVLSRTDNSDKLDTLKPDVLMLDEGHRAAGASAINKRIKRYVPSRIKEREAALLRGEKVRERAVRLLVASGTLEVKSVNDTQMLCAYALGTGSPLPLDANEAEAWSFVFDTAFKPDRKSLTAQNLHRVFGKGPPDPNDFDLFDTPEKALREGFQKWRANTPGVISASASDINASIFISEIETPKMPKVVKDALARVRVDNMRPDGEILEEKIEQLACAKNIACGFYTYWAFPAHPCTCVRDASGNPVDEEVRCSECLLIEDWYRKRKLYNKAQRAVQLLGLVHLDSDKNCELAAERYRESGMQTGFGVFCANCLRKAKEVAWPCSDPRHRPAWHTEHWNPWREIENRVTYEERVKWLGHDTPEAKDPKTHPGYFLARFVADWALKNKAVIWFQSVPLGRKIAELSGLPYFNGGPGGEGRLRAEKGDRSIICSVSAHGSGTDGLQLIFNTQMIVEVSPSNATTHGAEQLLGRLHRRGQPSDSVYTLIPLHAYEFKDALRKAIDQAWWNKEMGNLEQKLLLADIDVDDL